MLSGLNIALCVLAIDPPSWHSCRAFHSGSANSSLRSALRLPSFQNPFIFFHIDKTAGSTFEYYLYGSLQTLKEQFGCGEPGLSLVTCHDAPCWWRTQQAHQSTSCIFRRGSNYTPMLCEQTKFACASVYAGHFRPDLIPLLRQDITSDCLGRHRRWPQLPLPPTFTCITFLREPLARAISWYHDKRPNEARLLPFGNMTLGQQRHLLTEERVGSHMVAWLSAGAQEGEPPLRAAKMLLHTCVVGLTEELAASYEVIGARFPWMTSLPRGAALQKVLHPSSHIAVAELSSTHQTALRRELSPDVELYAYALQRFKQQ